MTPSPAPQHPDTPERSHGHRPRPADRPPNPEDHRHFALIRAATERRTVTAHTRTGETVTGTLVWWPHPHRTHRGTRATITLEHGRHVKIIADLDQITIHDTDTPPAVAS